MLGDTSTSTRILDAAMDVASERGLARLTLDNVATRAGVSRQTIYRHFGRREALVARVILREEDAVLSRVRSVIEDAATLGEAIEEAVVSLYDEARAHPLLDRLLRDEPEAILPYLLPSDTPVLASALHVVGELLDRFAADLEESGRGRLADMVTRLCLSYVVAPPGHDIRSIARDLAAMVDHLVHQPSSV